MIDRAIRKFKIIESHNGQDFEEQLNKVAADGKIIRYEYSHENGHSIFIELEEHVVIPENIKDEYALRGLKFYCEECPYFIAPTDRRIKYFPCQKFKTSRINYGNEACLWYYEAFEKGEIVNDNSGI